MKENVETIPNEITSLIRIFRDTPISVYLPNAVWSHLI